MFRCVGSRDGIVGQVVVPTCTLEEEKKRREEQSFIDPQWENYDLHLTHNVLLNATSHKYTHMHKFLIPTAVFFFKF